MCGQKLKIEKFLSSDLILSSADLEKLLFHFWERIPGFYKDIA